MAKGIAHFGIFILLIINTGPVSAMLVSDLLISEVMANPAALPDARGEWFELYNPTGSEINLRDITIGDDDGDRHKIESDLLIMPVGYLILTCGLSRRPGSLFHHHRSFISHSPGFQASSRYVGPPRKRGSCNESLILCQRFQQS